jgi:hypothetical protein
VVKVSKLRIGVAALLAVAVFASTHQGFAASPSGGAGEAQLDTNGQATLGELNKLLTEATDDTRKTCASGQAPEWVSAKRARYGTTERFADASDMCVATLRGIARDQRLLGYYRDLLAAMSGNPTLYAGFPRSIGAAVLNGTGKVSIGNGKAAVVTPALAFDAGFTVAYQEGNGSKAPNADAAQIKVLAESCLGQHEDAGTCFSAGYVYGARAFNARRASAH